MSRIHSFCVIYNTYLELNSHLFSGVNLKKRKQIKQLFSSFDIISKSKLNRIYFVKKFIYWTKLIKFFTDQWWIEPSTLYFSFRLLLVIVLVTYLKLSFYLLYQILSNPFFWAIVLSYMLQIWRIIIYNCLMNIYTDKCYNTQWNALCLYN